MIYLVFVLILLLMILLHFYLRLTKKFHELNQSYTILQEQFIFQKTVEEVKKPEPEKLFPKSPVCQFCKDPLISQVRKSVDGYWCCYNCSILNFGARSTQLTHKNG